MEITVNDETRTVDAGATVAALLDELGLARKPCAVEVNRTLVRKGDHATHGLTEGDRVELVTLVGGG
ncbi:MAG: sulfur carrier protein ThiS [Planctomycetota bacterium]